VTPDAYRAFIDWILSDLAERRTSTGVHFKRGDRRVEKAAGGKRPAPIRSNSLSYQGVTTFRGSDIIRRLNLAVAAAGKLEEIDGVLGRGKMGNACLAVADAVLSNSSPRIRARFFVGSRRRRSQAVAPAMKSPRKLGSKPDRLPGDGLDLEDVNRRIADAELLEAKFRKNTPRIERLANTIRTMVERYRKEKPPWTNEFQAWFEWFRADQMPDAEWLSGQRRIWGTFADRIDSGTGGLEWLELSPLFGFALICHRRGDHEEAVRFYEAGIRALPRAEIARPFHEYLVEQITSQLTACREKKPPPELKPWSEQRARSQETSTADPGTR